MKVVICCVLLALAIVISPAASDIDNTPPEISGCPDDQTLPAEILFSGKAARAYWDIPTVKDDKTATEKINVVVPATSGVILSVKDSPHVLTYTFTDEAGNEAKCTFTITVTNDGN